MKVILPLAVLLGLFASVLAIAGPWVMPVAASLSIWVQVIISCSGLVAAGVIGRWYLVPALFTRTVGPKLALVLADRLGEIRVILHSGIVYPTWRVLGEVSFTPIPISVDTFRGQSKFRTADGYPVDASVSAMLIVPKFDDAIIRAAERLEEPRESPGRIEFFDRMLREQLSECLESVTLANWDMEVGNAAVHLETRFNAAVSKFGHQVETMGRVVFEQARTEADKPTPAETRRDNAIKIEQAQQRKETNEKVEAFNDAHDACTSDFSRKAKKRQEEDARAGIDEELLTENKKAEKTAAEQANLHNATTKREEYEADLAKKRNEYSISEEKAKRDLEVEKILTLEKEQARIALESAFSRTQQLEASRAEVGRAELDADRQFALKRIDHRVIEEAIRYRRQILQQNSEFPHDDFEIELRRQELDLRKDLIFAQAKVMAAAYENTTTTVVADADAAARVTSAQLGGLAASAQLTQFVHSILNDELIMSTASQALGTILSARPSAERRRANTGEPRDGQAGAVDVDL